MKTQVELESLQEQLRVRKEKQYQLLEKLQGQEEAKRQAEDQVHYRLVPAMSILHRRDSFAHDDARSASLSLSLFLSFPRASRF